MRTRLCALVATAAVLTGCSGGRSSPRLPSPTPSTEAATITTGVTTGPTSGATGAGAPGQLYVSLGDSYAAGYQPGVSGPGATTRNGFAYLVPAAARAKGYDLKLVNFGCGGATVESMLQVAGCDQIGPGGQVYDNESQAAAADAFLSKNRDRVGLVTIVIGGNDVTRCALAQDPTSCVTTALQQIKVDLGTLTRGVRSAVGPDVQIVGLTYPDVVLGAWVTGSPDAQNLSRLSVQAFKALINPALADTYAAVGATFVDVTAATGAYGSLDEMTTLAPYGAIPVPVAKVCQLTFFCDRHDIHPTNDGYKLISDLVVGALKPR